MARVALERVDNVFVEVVELTTFHIQIYATKKINLALLSFRQSIKLKLVVQIWETIDRQIGHNIAES